MLAQFTPEHLHDFLAAVARGQVSPEAAGSALPDVPFVLLEAIRRAYQMGYQDALRAGAR